MIIITLCDHDLSKAEGYCTLHCELKERNKITVMMMMMMMMIIIIIIIIVSTTQQLEVETGSIIINNTSKQYTTLYQHTKYWHKNNT
jgi:accessory gene regulator protein AgrB